MISTPEALSNEQYKNKITEADLKTAGGLKRSKTDFFKTLDLPDRSTLISMGIRLQGRAYRITLGTLSKDKLEWDQGKFDEFSEGFVVKSGTELADKLLRIAESVEDFKAFLRATADKKKMNITLLSNLLPNLGRLLIESGRRIYVHPQSFNELEESIK